jgi:hypothetical protein
MKRLPWREAHPPRNNIIATFETTSPRNEEVASGEEKERPRNDISLYPVGDPKMGKRYMNQINFYGEKVKWLKLS